MNERKWSSIGLLGSLLIVAVVAVVGCHSGPAPLESVLRDDEWDAYQASLSRQGEDEAAAWLAWRSEETGEPVQKLRERDAGLSETTNPFQTTDPWAVRRGALVFRASCVECHGMKANGRGPAGESLMGTKDFSSSSMRSAIAMDGGRLAHWYTKVANGSVSGRVMPDGTPADMPAMRQRLTREQIWLALTWLGSDASMAVGAD